MDHEVTARGGGRLPIRRFLAEGTMIVLSILLAFAIDAGWNSLQEGRSEDATLSALAADFALTAQELRAFEDMNHAAFMAADTLIGLLQGQSGYVEVPVATVVSALRPATPDPPLGALESLISSGRLGLIGDPELRQALASWPASLRDLQSKSALGQDFIYQQLLPRVVRQTEVSALIEGRLRQVMRRQRGPEPTYSDLGHMKLPASQELIGLLEMRRLFAALLKGDNWIRVQSTLNHILAGLERSAPS